MAHVLEDSFSFGLDFDVPSNLASSNLEEQVSGLKLGTKSQPTKSKVIFVSLHLYKVTQNR